ncbi:uncharacterized protein BDZ99DRAFT_464044 [Mytilinidion resinicola]|uniref:Uncharacterized protein n=1 Tax=Mytilinidion resinicola TaxID=574789 RepID=A0A6A6YHU2_9PEZI|nr:uncharacterized protein BDZ99DRAFT_464044 [Mytilinidion resinicola]KAF2808148.1 hypothetical protein BDZ99DRAFT_464044 [Mytilinidion resinicola]
MSSSESPKGKGTSPAKGKRRILSKGRGEKLSKSKSDEALRQSKPVAKLPEGHPEWLKPAPYDFSGAPVPANKKLHGNAYGEMLPGVAARIEQKSAEIRAGATADGTTSPDGKRPRDMAARGTPKQWWRCCKCEEVYVDVGAEVCYNHREDDYHLRCRECSGNSGSRPETVQRPKTPRPEQDEWS